MLNLSVCLCKKIRIGEVWEELQAAVVQSAGPADQQVVIHGEGGRPTVGRPSRVWEQMGADRAHVPRADRQCREESLACHHGSQGSNETRDKHPNGCLNTFNHRNKQPN